jgi:hypothetical protein
MENLKGEVMRWKTWQPPNVGDKRIKTKFLILLHYYIIYL